MSTPLFKPQSIDQLKKEREDVVVAMLPYDADILRRLRDDDAISLEQETLLEQFESLTWLIDG